MDDELQRRIFERLKNTLEDMHQQAEELKGEHSLPADELFPPSFMHEHTSFENIEEFLVNGHFGIESGADWDPLADERLDRHVQKTTDFESWAEMKETATCEWALEELTS